MNGLVVFPTFFNLSLNLAIRSSWSESQSAHGLVFFWLYRASPSLAAKNIIDLILVLTIWWCPCVESSLVLLEEGVCYDQYIVLAKLSLCPASFRTPRPNLPVIPGISWLPTFALQSPIMKRTSFLGVSSKMGGANSWHSSKAGEPGCILRLLAEVSKMSHCWCWPAGGQGWGGSGASPAHWWEEPSNVH